MELMFRRKQCNYCRYFARRNLDFNEFQASIESVYMALANDYKVLTDLIK